MTRAGARAGAGVGAGKNGLGFAGRLVLLFHYVRRTARRAVSGGVVGVASLRPMFAVGVDAEREGRFSSEIRWGKTARGPGCAVIGAGLRWKAGVFLDKRLQAYRQAAAGWRYFHRMEPI